MEEEYLQELIRKYITGTITPAERLELRDWYRSKTDEGYLWPYENIAEEESAKASMLYNLQQRINGGKARKTVVLSLYIKVAAAVLILIGSFFVFCRIRSTGSNALAFNIVNTKAGEHKIIKLADGSTIWLSAKSSLRYPLAFNGATREISFTGEAFFEIAKDKKHPFIVHTGKTSTRVLGTSFNITALSGKPTITVALITGKVAFSDGKSDVKLLPGHEVVYDKVNGTTGLQDIPDMAVIVARKNGDYEYKNTPVADVIEDVNLNFNTNFGIEGKVKSCPFFGRIKPGESPVAFLKKLAIVVNAEVVQSGNEYIIKGGGCD